MVKTSSNSLIYIFNYFIMTIKNVIVPDKYQFALAETSASKAFMGISAGKPLFTNSDAMRAYARFGHETFKSFTFVIFDLPKRHNLMALEGIDEVRAIYRAAIMGIDTDRLLRKAQGNYKNVTVSRYIDFSNEPQYSHNLEVLKNAYKTDGQFSFACNEFVLSFLSLPANIERAKIAGNTLEERIRICKNYALEELAMLLALPLILNGNGSVYEIYPGENNKLQERLENKEFSFCHELLLSPNKQFMEAYYGFSMGNAY